MASRKEIWSEALFQFLQEEFDPGEPIPFSWFLEHFRIETPQVCTASEWRKHELNILGYMMPFRKKLLTEHFIDLQPIGNSMWAITPPAEQTSQAMTQMSKDYKRSNKRGTYRLRYLNTEGLTQQQIQENADALSKVSQLKALAQPIWS